MPVTFNRPILIFRIAHYSNLDFTLRNGVYCRNSSLCDPDYINIGHRNLIDKRGQRAVPVSPFGVLNDYVPFYLAPRSPMLYSINKGNVQGYNGTQREIIYLISSVEEIKKANRLFAFTDGHAYQEISNFYNEENDLDKIDWKIMGETYWNNTPEDNDRMRRRMAEFLVFQFVPANSILAIVVYDDIIKQEVDSIQNKCGTQIKTFIKRNWYY